MILLSMVIKTPPTIRPYFRREKLAYNKIRGFHELLSGFELNFPCSHKFIQIVENYFKTNIAIRKSPTFYFRLIFLGENRA